jgi:hypothetical protein
VTAEAFGGANRAAPAFGVAWLATDPLPEANGILGMPLVGGPAPTTPERTWSTTTMRARIRLGKAGKAEVTATVFAFDPVPFQSLSASTGPQEVRLK